MQATSLGLNPLRARAVDVQLSWRIMCQPTQRERTPHQHDSTSKLTAQLGISANLKVIQVLAIPPTFAQATASSDQMTRKIFHVSKNGHMDASRMRHTL